MTSLQVQPAGHAATPAASALLTDLPASGDSTFGATLVRALGNLVASADDTSTGDPKAAPGLSRSKSGTGSSSDSSSMASSLLGCLMTLAAQPAPKPVSSVESGDSEVPSNGPGTSTDAASSLGSDFYSLMENAGSDVGPSAIAATVGGSTGAITSGTAETQQGKVLRATQGLTTSTSAGITETLPVGPAGLAGQEKVQGAQPSNGKSPLARKTSSPDPSSTVDVATVSTRNLLGGWSAPYINVASETSKEGAAEGNSSTESDSVQTGNAAPAEASASNLVLPASTGSQDSELSLAEGNSAPVHGSSDSIPQQGTDAPDAELSTVQTSLANPQVRVETSGATSSSSASENVEASELANLPGNFAMSVKASAASPEQAAEPQKPTDGTDQVGQHKVARDLSPGLPGSHVENAAAISAKASPHNGQFSTRSTIQDSGQTSQRDSTSSQLPATTTAATPAVTSTSSSENSPPSPPATGLSSDSAPASTVIQPSGTVSTSSDESGSQGNTTDSSNNGRSGQQGGSASSENPAAVAAIVPGNANPAAPQAVSLIAVHTPSAPVNHANAIVSTPPPPPPSGQPASLSAWQNYEGGAGKIVRSASLSEGGGSAEMHVEFRSGALGPLEVHAVVHEGVVGAEIHVQGQEAHTLLSAGLPSLERALGERNLHIENLGVYQDHGGGGLSSGADQNPHPQSPDPDSVDAPAMSRSSKNHPSADQETPMEDNDLMNPATGLSVEA